MHDGMQFDPIQGQGHKLLKVGNLAIFTGYLLPIYNRGWQMTTDSYIRAQYLICLKVITFATFGRYRNVSRSCLFVCKQDK